MINVVKEKSKIKNGVFDGGNSFIYSTETHLNYILLNGKNYGSFKSS
jgi:hypothetical protein